MFTRGNLRRVLALLQVQLFLAVTLFAHGFHACVLPEKDHDGHDHRAWQQELSCSCCHTPTAEHPPHDDRLGLTTPVHRDSCQVCDFFARFAGLPAVYLLLPSAATRLEGQLPSRPDAPLTSTPLQGPGPRAPPLLPPPSM